MKKTQLIQNPLILPHEIPLFDYNVNFHGLKKLLEDFNVSLNDQKMQIDYLKEMLALKEDKQSVNKQFSLLNGAMDLSKPSMEKLNIKNVPGKNKQKSTINEIVQKMGYITSGLDKVLADTHNTDKNLSDLDNKIEDRLKRLQNQLQLKNDNLDKTITKNIESYFKDVNTSTSKLEAAIKDSQSRTAGKLADAFTLLDRKINVETLDSKISGVETKILGKMNSILDEDGMKRVKLTNDLIMNVQNSENKFKDKYDIMERVLADLMQKVNSNQTKTDFQKQKNKIYQNISQAKSRLDDVQRKAQQFFDFKRSLIVQSEKTKVQTANMIQNIERLQQKMTSTAGLSNVQGLLQKLDPHKICQIDNLCRLHDDLLSKLQKKVMQLSQKTNNIKIQNDPQKKTQQINADEIVKLIKDYMLSYDIEARMKKNEVDIKDFNSTIDLIKDMDRKIQLFTKEFDYNFIVKQLQKRCTQQNTRRESKITNGRIDQLHQFLKMMRKDVQSLADYVKSFEQKSNTPQQNALLSSKKLYPLSCLSCKPEQRRRSTRDIRTKVDTSMDFMGSRQTQEDVRRRLLQSFQTVRR